jgi:hypothetical protein
MKFLAASALAIILATAIAAPAVAQNYEVNLMSANGGFIVNRAGALMLPPPEYDKPFTGEIVLIRANRERMEIACPKSLYPLTIGCATRYPPAWSRDGKDYLCVVIILNDELLKEVSPWSYEVIWRHEIGHCNGWKGHAGARPLVPLDVVPFHRTPVRGERPSDLAKKQKADGSDD